MLFSDRQQRIGLEVAKFKIFNPENVGWQDKKANGQISDELVAGLFKLYFSLGFASIVNLGGQAGGLRRGGIELTFLR